MSRDIKYIGMDVHKEAIVIAVLNGSGKLVMESIVETKASSILQFIHGLRGELHVTWEEGTWATWLYDLLQPQAAQVLVCDPRRNAFLKEGNKSDKIDARKLADLLRTGMLRPVYHGEHGLRTLRELGRSYQTISQDLNRVMNRIKALYRGWSIPCAGTQVYAPRNREEWLHKIEHAGVRRRAQLLYEQLDGLQTLRRTLRPELLAESRKHKASKLLMTIRARAGLVRARTALVNTARGLAKSYGERLRGCNVRDMDSEKAEGLSPELQRALEPLLSTIEELSERIVEYNDRIEALAQTSYPQVELLKQIKGVGTLIALTFLLTLEDPHRFRKSRDVGGYLGLQPGRRKSGESEPQMHISKEGDPYLRTLLVQGAQHILGPFGIDCDLRRWGLKLAERGGRNGKKRAIVATARKLAVLLHHLWISGEVYDPLHNSSRLTVAAAA